jgi:hypothetical protein
MLLANRGLRGEAGDGWVEIFCRIVARAAACQSDFTPVISRRFEVLTALLMKIIHLEGMTFCRFVDALEVLAAFITSVVTDVPVKLIPKCC